MISISCSKLERVKNNPRLFGQMLATGEEKQNKRRHGMFACLKNTICEVHTGGITAARGVKKLQNLFLQFAANTKNKTKQAKLIEHYTIYHKLFAQQNWVFACATKNMQWPLHNEVMLTGHTPWTFKSPEGYIAYYITETALPGWRNELRFPLIQQYLAEKILHCEPSNIKLGYYALNTAKFDLERFDEAAIEEAVEVTSNVFKNVYDAFIKSKQVLMKKPQSSLDTTLRDQKKSQV